MAVFLGAGAVATGAMGGLYGAMAFTVAAAGYVVAAEAEYDMAEDAAKQGPASKKVSAKSKENTHTKSREYTNWIEIQPQTLETVKGRVLHRKSEEKTASGEKILTVNQEILGYLKKERPSKE